MSINIELSIKYKFLHFVFLPYKGNLGLLFTIIILQIKWYELFIIILLLCSSLPKWEPAYKENHNNINMTLFLALSLV